jgi:circadian clock protein KaiB
MAAETPPDEPAPARTRVRLYIAGEGPNSVAAVANLKAALAEYAAHGIELEIIDVVTDPERALRDGILVTPMLVKVAPAPERRVLGTLQNRGTLLGALGIPPGDK